MSWFNRIVWIFVAPSRVFAELREGRVPWWQPWIVQSALALAAGYLSIPSQRAVLALNPRGMSADQLQQSIDFFDRFRYAQLAVIPPTMLLVSLALAGITYVVVTLLSSKANFRQYFTITLFASVVSTVSVLVSSAVVRSRGVDAIRVPEDAQMSLGLGFLIPGGVWHAVLSSIDVFAVWSFILIAMGLERVFDMPRRHSVVSVIPWLLITVVLAAVGQLFGAMG